MVEFLARNVIAAIAALLIVSGVSYLIFQRQPPHNIISGVTVPREIPRGTEYHIQWELNTLPPQCPGTIYFFLTDSSMRTWVESPRQASFGLLPGGTKYVEGSPHIMPKGISLGEVSINIVVRYVCDWSQLLFPVELKYPTIKTKAIE